MANITAGQSPILSESDRLSEVFVAYADRVTRFIYSRLDRPDWHLAEDLSSEVFLRLVRWYSDRAIDERVRGLLYQMARQVIAQHFRRRSSTETPTDFSGITLPVFPAAEDIAAVRIEARDMLASRPVVASPAVEQQVEALAVLAVAA
jgi:DNA-directed RNA polymerase specialized sigma24 family protein